MSKSAAAAGPYSLLALIDEVPTLEHCAVMRDTIEDFAKLTQAWADHAAQDAGPSTTLGEIAVHLRVASRLYNALAELYKLAQLEEAQAQDGTSPTTVAAEGGPGLATGRKPYRTPSLTYLGRFSDLTHSGNTHPSTDMGTSKKPGP